MISWIVATHDRAILDACLGPTVPDGDELIVVEGAASIADAYNTGTAGASHPVRCYVHHDVVLVDPGRLRAALLKHCTTDVGMVGVIGCRAPVVPWWSGDVVGSVVDTRRGMGRLGPGGHGPAAYLDGLLLATSHTVSWDDSYDGWHGYDHDMCRQMLDRGLTNWCLPDGHQLVRHESHGSRNPERIPGWDAALARFAAKWGDGGT